MLIFSYFGCAMFGHPRLSLNNFTFFSGHRHYRSKSILLQGLSMHNTQNDFFNTKR